MPSLPSTPAEASSSQAPAFSVTGGWGQLSERTQKRLEEMLACGVPRDAADLMAAVITGIGADSTDWSIFADLEASPATLQLWHEKSGAHIECSNLGGPNT